MRDALIDDDGLTDDDGVIDDGVLQDDDGLSDDEDSFIELRVLNATPLTALRPMQQLLIR